MNKKPNKNLTTKTEQKHKHKGPLKKRAFPITKDLENAIERKLCEESNLWED